MSKKTAHDLADWLGYLTREEVDILKKLSTDIKSKNPVIVNIGAGAGTSGLAFAEARPDADLYTIDISKGGPLGGLESERNAFKDADRMIPTQLLGDSKEVGEDWSLPIDLLFVDGDHSSEGVRGDIESWLPHVKRYGLIVFHDYENTKWGAVKKIVDELMSEYTDAGSANRIKAFKKLKKRKPTTKKKTTRRKATKK